MMRKTVVLMALALAPGCTTEGYQGEELGQVVLPGKEDNFLSTKAQEYMVEGTTTVTLEAELAQAPEEQKLARVHELIPLKQVVVGWFLNEYIREKSEHDTNQGYGGFSALTKNGSYEELGIEAVDARTYRFTFRQEFGGKMNLLDVLPTQVGEDGRRYFDLTIGKISNSEMAQLETNYEWYRRAPWSDFDPSKVDPSRLETVRLAVWPEPRSTDAFIDYNRLIGDGVITIAVHFGWDYHNEYHLKHSRTVYDWLVSNGFKSPVASYDELTRLSGPFTKTLSANGKDVRVEISLFFGKPGTDCDPDTDAGGRVLEDDMRRSFREKEVIVFSGHSGPFYGFALANWRKTDEGDLDDSEIPTLEMPSDVYQVVLAEGCDTYALGQAFRMNPAKAGTKNIDVITTTSFSNASTPQVVQDFLRSFFEEGAGGLKARTYGDVLSDLEDNSFFFNTMYGVHGLDDNPHGHPFGRLDKLCTPCTSNSDCGGEGNQCTVLGENQRFCTYACTADDGCPEGYKCMPVAYGYYIKTKQCVPANLTCDVEPPKPARAPVIINEVFPAPNLALDDGDANGDGEVDGMEDEFVELLNISSAPVDMSGFTVEDSAMTRHTFPEGTILQPGKALVLFGGGDPSAFSSLGGALKAVAQHGLGLNNSGDTVTLRDKAGNVLDTMSYGPNNRRSLVRERDGDPDAPFVPHPDVTHSAGLKQDGQPF